MFLGSLAKFDVDGSSIEIGKSKKAKKGKTKNKKITNKKTKMANKDGGLGKLQ